MGSEVRRIRPAVVAFIAASAVLAAGVLYAYHDLFGGPGQIHYEEADKLSTWGEPTGRVLVILFDAGRMDFTFSEHMPFVSSCRERGAWGASEVASIPLSVAGHRSIFAGTVANPLAFFDDFHAPTSTVDNLFMRLQQKGVRAVIFDHCVRSLYGEYTDQTVYQPRGHSLSEYREQSAHVFQHAHGFLSTEQWDVAAVAFYALDYLGHLETPSSPNYVPTVRLIDDYVRQLVELTNENDVVLMTSEHGMDDSGFHMDRVPIVIECPFVLLGPRVNTGGPKRVLQIDWAPTLSLLAGVSPFYDSPALPNLDLIQVPEKDRLALLQKFSKVMAQTPRPLPLDELRAARLDKLARRGSIGSCAVVAIAALLSMALLMCVGLFDPVEGQRPRPGIVAIGAGTLGLVAVTGAANALGFFDCVGRYAPFSANLILAQVRQFES